MDYGRYKYLQKQKQAEQKRAVSKVLLKEVKLTPKTGEHDVNFRIEHIRGFLKEGHKVKVTIMHKGREIVHQDYSRRHTDLIAKTIVEEGLGTVESPAMMMGRQLTLILAPKNAAPSK